MTEVTRKEIGRAIDTAQLLKLRRDGYPIEHIAGVMKMSPIACLAAINDALKELQGDSRDYADQIREIELQRLDLATKAVMPAVEKGDREAIDLMLKVQKRRSAYLGLDDAKKVDAHVTIKIDAPWMSPQRLSYNRQEVINAETVSPVSMQERAERATHELADASARHAATGERLPLAKPMVKANELLPPTLADPRSGQPAAGPKQG